MKQRAGFLSAACAASLALAWAGATAKAFAAPSSPTANPAVVSRPPAPPVKSGYIGYPGYQKLLDELLTVISAPGEPLDTRFDYEKFYDAPGRFERCTRIKRELLAVPPSAMNPRTRMAWAINTYNYLVIEAITENLLMPNRGRQRYPGPRDIRLPGGSLFSAPLVEIEGQSYSLDAFERHFLFADFDREKGGSPPPNLDPRIHFALVCGAIGCPPLQPRAYRPDSIGIQLEFATRNALALPRHLEFKPESGRVQASSIFQWYVADFGGSDNAFSFLLEYAPAATRVAIQLRKITSIAGLTPWDWNLNQTARKKEI